MPALAADGAAAVGTAGAQIRCHRRLCLRASPRSRGRALWVALPPSSLALPTQPPSAPGPANAAPALPGSTPAAKLERAGALGTATPPAAPLATAPAANASAVTRNGVPDFAVMLAWIESLDASGLDGRDLAEIGLKG